MQHAPSVSYPVGRSVFQAALLVLLSFLLAWVVLWFAATSDSVMRTALLLLGWWLVSVWAGWSYLRSPTGHLAWRAGQWWLNEDDGKVIVLQDLSSVVLLHWQAAAVGGKTRWIWLEKNKLPGEWLSLRRALYSPQISPLQQQT